MNHSPVMDEFWQHDLPQPIAGLRQRHHELRNLHQDIIKQVQHQLQVRQYCLPVARPAVHNHPLPHLFPNRGPPPSWTSSTPSE